MNNDATGWVVRSYQWKGDPHCALYRGNHRLGTIRASQEHIMELVVRLGAQHIDVGEVRDEHIKREDERLALKKAAHTRG